jgi:hypothetical protein
MAEDNPFDPIHSGSYPNCFQAPTAVPDWKDWGQQTNTPPYADWLAIATATPGATPAATAIPYYEQYNLFDLKHTTQPNYRPYNGRWVYLLTQIPDPTTYNSVGAPSGNPNPWWWYLQYYTNGTSVTDRVVYEAFILNTPPHLTQ